MPDNGQTHDSGALSVQHVYALSRLIHCERCRSKMDGESVTGNIGKKYFYYKFCNRECQMRVAAYEVEQIIVDRLQMLGEDPELLDQLTAVNCRKLKQGRPKMERQIAGTEKDLTEVKSMADKLLSALVSVDEQAGQNFIKNKLNTLGQRWVNLENGLTESSGSVMV